MGMYDTIVNPITNRKVNIYSNSGIHILNQYIKNYQKGGLRCSNLSKNKCLKLKPDCLWGKNKNKTKNICYDPKKISKENTLKKKKKSIRNMNRWFNLDN